MRTRYAVLPRVEPHWILVLSGLLIVSGEAAGQTTENNVVTGSADAFGVSIGVEALGLYGPGAVRGFDPLAAGNARIEGMYADVHGPIIPYGPLPARLIDNTRIRVGPAAAGFPFPSPTGIVDFSLRSPLGAAGISPTVYVGPYGTSGFDLDAHAPVAGQCGVGAGVTRRWDEFVPALTQFTTDVGMLGSCRWSGDSKVTVFYGRTTETRSQVYPTLYLTTAPTPEPFESRNTGPSWAQGSTVLMDYGALLTLQAPGNWTIRASLFRSVYDQPTSGTELMSDPSAAGLAQTEYVAYPDQFTGSTSGELRASHLMRAGPRDHELILTLRARDVTARYGGFDDVPLPDQVVGVRPTIAEPVFTFGPVTTDHTQQWTYGFAYALHWKDVVEFSAGVERARYERTVLEPATAPATLRETPLLYYVSASVPISANVSAYGALTRGLEDSGLAPASASNRGQLLPASRTRQEEMGARYTRGTTTLVAGLFQVRKPYYNIGGDGSYTWLGTETHRGLELSLNTDPLAGLAVVAGAVLMTPQVASATGSGPVGSEPIGQPRRILQLAADYRIPAWARCSLDFTATQLGRMPVRLDDGAYIPAQTIVNIGARYRFNAFSHEATLRLQVQNVTDRKIWAVMDTSGGLAPYPPGHMALAYLSADL